jgi:hypothetical protein
VLIRTLDWEAAADRTLPEAAPPGWIRQWCCDRSANTVTSPVRSGQYSARFELHRGDATVSSSKRAEVSEPTPRPGARERVERWYGFSIFLPEEWVSDPSAEILTQWHHAADTGSPPLALGTKDGQWQISRHWENHEEHALPSRYETGRWTDWVVHARWSPGTDGLVEAWRDGSEVYCRTGKNKYDDGRPVYMKFGIYKWDWQSKPSRSRTDRRVMYYDSLRVADETGNRETVDPAGPPAQAVILRPRSDVVPWTVRGGATASEVLDDAVIQPTPVRAGNHIWAGGVDRVTEVKVGTTSAGAGSTAQAWFYANTGIDTRLRVDVTCDGDVLVSTVVDSDEPFRWRSIPFPITAAVTGRELGLRFTALDGGDSNVRAAYVAVEKP